MKTIASIAGTLFILLPTAYAHAQDNAEWIVIGSGAAGVVETDIPLIHINSLLDHDKSYLCARAADFHKNASTPAR